MEREQNLFKFKQCWHPLSDNEIITDVQHVCNQLGKDSITITEYRKHGKHYQSARRRWKSWDNILRKCGLKNLSNVNRNYTIDDLFNNFAEVWINLRRQPYVTDFEKYKGISKFCASTYKRKFGGWQNTLNEFAKWIKKNKNTSINHCRSAEIVKHKTSRNINLALRWSILERDHFKCVKCGKSPSTDPKVILQVDHIIPWSKGGETIFENLQTLCQDCNLGKSNK